MNKTGSYTYGTYPVGKWFSLPGTDVELLVRTFPDSDTVTIEKRIAA